MSLIKPVNLCYSYVLLYNCQEKLTHYRSCLLFEYKTHLSNTTCMLSANQKDGICMKDRYVMYICKYLTVNGSD